MKETSVTVQNESRGLDSSKDGKAIVIVDVKDVFVEEKETLCRGRDRSGTKDVLKLALATVTEKVRKWKELAGRKESEARTSASLGHSKALDISAALDRGAAAARAEDVSKLRIASGVTRAEAKRGMEELRRVIVGEH